MISARVKVLQSFQATRGVIFIPFFKASQMHCVLLIFFMVIPLFEKERLTGEVFSVGI
jgi:hypothetical protein